MYKVRLGFLQLHGALSLKTLKPPRLYKRQQENTTLTQHSNVAHKSLRAKLLGSHSNQELSSESTLNNQQLNSQAAIYKPQQGLQLLAVGCHLAHAQLNNSHRACWTPNSVPLSTAASHHMRPSSRFRQHTHTGQQQLHQCPTSPLTHVNTLQACHSNLVCLLQHAFPACAAVWQHWFSPLQRATFMQELGTMPMVGPLPHSRPLLHAQLMQKASGAIIAPWHSSFTWAGQCHPLVTACGQPNSVTQNSATMWPSLSRCTQAATMTAMS